MKQKIHIFNEYFQGSGYVTPCFMIEYFFKLLRKYGKEVVWNKNKFKQFREAFITAIFLLGLSENTKRQYWLGKNPEDSAPDTYGIHFETIEKGTKRNIMNIEIFEWEEHSRSNLVEAIEKKLKNKKYPSYYLLLCWIHQAAEFRMDLADVFSKLKSKHIKLAEVWLLGDIKHKHYDKAIVRVFPEFSRIDFKIIDVYKKNREQAPRMIKDMGRGKHKKFIPLSTDKAILPFPKEMDRKEKKSIGK